MRELPDSCIPFASPEGRQLFMEALQAGTMNCYFPLAAQFRTQDEPAFCGVTTLVMTLNALSIDPRKRWKGPWRWFHEDNVACCSDRERILTHGINLDVFTCMARCNSASAEVHRAWRGPGDAPLPAVELPPGVAPPPPFSEACCGGNSTPRSGCCPTGEHSCSAQQGDLPLQHGRHHHHHHHGSEAGGDCCSGGAGAAPVASAPHPSSSCCPASSHSCDADLHATVPPDAGADDACTTGCASHGSPSGSSGSTTSGGGGDRPFQLLRSHGVCCSEAGFRAAVAKASANGSGDEFMVLSYSRAALGQTGDGHFSPMGGYHPGRDMLLILDVARFKYPPHWVSVSALWRAMQRLDSETGLPRGYVMVRRMASAPLLLFHLASAAGGGASSSGSGSSSASTPSCLSVQIKLTMDGAFRSLRQQLFSAEANAPFVTQEDASVEGGHHHHHHDHRHHHHHDGLHVPPAAHAAALQEAVRRFVATFQASAPASAMLQSVQTLSGLGYEPPAEGTAGEPAAAAGGAAAAAAAAAPAGSLLSPVLVGGAQAASGEDARCVDKVSREHIQATLALLAQLESTQLYQLVTAALGEPRRGSDAASASEGEGEEEPSECDRCGVSCVRIKKSHVLSMLAIAWAVPPSSFRPAALPPLARALATEVRAALRTAPDALHAEAGILHQQVHDASVCLFGGGGSHASLRASALRSAPAPAPKP